MRVFTWMLLTFATPTLANAGEITIAVMEFTSKGGVNQQQMDALGDMLANEIRDRGNFRVTGKSDIRAVLDLEQKKTMVGCSDNACIAEIGGALGVKWVVIGNVSQFGETYLLNLKLLDTEKVRVAWGSSRQVKGTQDKLLGALSESVSEMIAKVFAEKKEPVEPPVEPGKVVAKEAKTKPPEDKPIPPPPKKETPVLAAEAPSRPFNTWGHVSMWTGVGLVVVGGLSAWAASSEADHYADENEDPGTRVDSADMSRTWTGVMWAGFGLGAALIATGTVLWLLEPDAPATASVGPTLDGQGAVFTFGGRW